MKPKNPESPRITARKTAKTSATAAPVAKAKTTLTAAAPAAAKAKAASTTVPVAPPVAKAKAAPPAAAPVATPVAKAKAASTAAAPAAVSMAKAKTTPTAPAPVAVPMAKAKATPPAAAHVAAPVSKAKAASPAAAPAAAKAKRATRSTRLKIPPILLEGDAPADARRQRPGPALRARSEAAQPSRAVQPAVELPEAYGTQQLFLTARDPHWLYAHWDMTREQLKKYNALSVDRHLVLRVYRGALSGEPLSQIHLHPESRNWFVPVPDAGAKYLADLGYYDTARQWVSLARSGATFTPPDSLSDDLSVRFATIPPEVPFAELLALVKSALREHVPLVEAHATDAGARLQRPPGSRTSPEPNGRPPRKKLWRKSSPWTRCAASGSARWKSPN